MNYPAASCGVSKPQNPTTSEQCQLDVLAMQLLIRLFLPLLFDILADDFFTAVTSNGADTVAFGPQFATPELLFDRWHTMKDFPGSNTFDNLHNLGWTLRGHRLHQEMDVIRVRANL
jgi:hypothetical protein